MRCLLNSKIYDATKITFRAAILMSPDLPVFRVKVWLARLLVIIMNVKIGVGGGGLVTK